MSEPAIPSVVNCTVQPPTATIVLASPTTFSPIGQVVDAMPLPVLVSWSEYEPLGTLILDFLKTPAVLARFIQVSSFGKKVYFGDQSKDKTVKTKVLSIEQGVLKEIELITLAPLSIGQCMEFYFPITTDHWVDPTTGLLYFKPCGKTIGRLESGADFVYADSLQALFMRLHSNSYLQLFDRDGVPLSKTLAMDDWLSDCRLALPFFPGAATYSAGSAAVGETNWVVGMASGTSQYTIPLVRHSHEVLEEEHNHGIIQLPHVHPLAGYTYDADAGEGSDGNGSAFHPVAGETLPASIEISMTPERVNLSVSESGGDNSLFIQTPGYCVEKMIFTGVKI